MTYDFTSILDRADHDAIALDAIGAPGSVYPAPDGGLDPIPMWIADMNFPVAPSITRAIEERLQYPTFGYFRPSDAYYQSIIDWHRVRKGVDDLKPDHIGYENGVLGGVVFSESGPYVFVVMTDLSADLDGLTPLLAALDEAHEVMCGGATA